MNTERSRALFAHAQEIIPGGVNSPVRACRNVNAEPLFIAEAQGAHLITVDGDHFIDVLGSWGPMLVGHAHPEVTEAIQKAALRGTSYGAPSEAEVLLAEEVCAALPSVEMVRMVNSGTEATMSALRLARGVTGRTKMIKFIGGYHGHGDAFLASAGSGVATFSIPGTPGVPASTVADTLLAPYNDLEAVKKLFEANPGQIAALFVEPVAGNMGLMLPQPGFLEGLRELCTQNGTILVFDEVITGFRLSYGGAQGRFGIMPDLTTFGKIIGGGLPVGAYGGRADLMKHIAPQGEVYQAGTLSGNPLAMAAGLATLNILKRSDYAGLEARVDAFVAELEQILKSKGVPAQIPHIASLFTIYFTEAPLRDFASVQTSDVALFESFFKQMRAQGIFMAPSAFEANMLSFAHSEEDFAKALEAARNVKF